MFSRGMQMAMLASALVAGSRNDYPDELEIGNNWPLGPRNRRLLGQSASGRVDRHPRTLRVTEDLTKRPTPALAPEKPLTKRQKRRLRGKS